MLWGTSREGQGGCMFKHLGKQKNLLGVEFLNLERAWETRRVLLGSRF